MSKHWKCLKDHLEYLEWYIIRHSIGAKKKCKRMERVEFIPKMYCCILYSGWCGEWKIKSLVNVAHLGHCITLTTSLSRKMAKAKHSKNIINLFQSNIQSCSNHITRLCDFFQRAIIMNSSSKSLLREFVRIFTVHTAHCSCLQNPPPFKHFKFAKINEKRNGTQIKSTSFVETKTPIRS